MKQTKRLMIWADDTETAKFSIKMLDIEKLLDIKHFIKYNPDIIRFYNFSREEWIEAITQEIGRRHGKTLGFLLALKGRFPDANLKVHNVFFQNGVGLFDEHHVNKAIKTITEHKEQQQKVVREAVQSKIESPKMNKRCSTLADIAKIIT